MGRLGAKDVEIFLQPEVLNVFDEQGVSSSPHAASTTVCTSPGPTLARLQSPYTQTPVEGVHWRKGPLFGQPNRASTETLAGDFQAPRTFRFSVGVRF